MSTAARETILNKLRSANVDPLPAPEPARFYANRPHEDLPTRVERLALNLKNAMAEVHRTTATDLTHVLEGLISENRIRCLAVGNEVLSDQSMSAQLEKACTLFPVTGPDWQLEVLFDSVDAGLTYSVAAIAETGTIVLQSSSASPRQLSLVPPVHIVIVDAGRVVNRLFDLTQQTSWANGLPTNVILVSSPSKTADIQQTLAYGAHGPKRLIVILVEGA